MFVLPPIWLLVWGFCGPVEAPCPAPRLWYSPESNDVVHWGCTPPGDQWRAEPFFGQVGADLTGELRGPRGVFMAPTGDTAVLAAAREGGDDAALDTGGTGLTGDTAAPPESGATADTGAFLDTAEPPAPARRGPRRPASEPATDEGDTLATTETGELVDTADTFLDLDTGEWTGDTAQPPPNPVSTADTGELEEALDDPEPDAAGDTAIAEDDDIADEDDVADEDDIAEENDIAEEREEAP